MAQLLHQLLQSAADESPGRIAVVDGLRSLTYAELDRSSTQLANLLSALGVQRGDRVALFLDKSPESIIGLYGVL